MGRARASWMLVLLATAFTVGCGQGVLSSGGACRVPWQADEWAREVIDLVNAERVAEGMAPLRADGTLAEMAEDYACEMVEGEFFAHENPDTGSTPGTRADDHGYVYYEVGENLAVGYDSPEDVMVAWMDSPGHRANILHDSYTELGVGVRVALDGQIYWVQEFGDPWP
ncbi:MAG TPA: CAP domain-containing protein [Phycisphaerae bacterium]|nr:CAP domain-containing protein [Phycisphaerae bacterium]